MPQLQNVRKFTQQNNPWGHFQFGPDAQRTDLWQVDFRETVKNLVGVAGSINSLSTLKFIQPFEVQSVTLPELKTRAEAVPRDSRSFMMPSMDEALDAIRMVFVMNSDQSLSSNLIKVLNGWRALVRAGRGAMSSEPSFALNANYTVDFAFNVTLKLARPGAITATGGQSVPANQSVPPNQNVGAPGLTIPNTAASPTAGSSQLALHAAVSSSVNGMSKADYATNFSYTLVKCWLSSHKVSEMSYADAKIMTVEATFYAEDIVSHKLQSSSAYGQYAAPNALGVIGTSPALLDTSATNPVFAAIA